jgi:ferric-dicitrate binding protein FerR (iron transport regulator)
MTDEEDVTAQLLRLAGAPADPPAERSARVREVVHREWLVGRRRRVVRRGAVIALLGVAASLVTAVWMNRPHSVAPPGNRVVAIGQRIQGRPLILRQSQHPGTPQPLTASSSVYPGDLIQTDDMSRAALLAADGSSVRIDRASRLRFLEPAVIEVIAGGAYVATSNGSRGFVVRTAMGAVRDLGTQFEVRLTASSLRIRVRSGAVELGRDATITTAEAGTEAMVTSTGVAVRRLPAYGPEWAWTTDVAPPFAIEGRSLRAFLEHLAGEEGWILQYANAGVAEAAGRTILHGSVEGLQAEQALGVALATSGLQYRLRAGELLVSRAADAR